jgi:hypothetical protein
LRRLAIVALVIAAATPARGYVRSRTAHGKPLFWPGGCVYVQTDLTGSPDLPMDTLQMVLKKCLDNWNTPTASCSYLQLLYDPPSDLEAHLDGKNLVKFRTDKWCHPEDKQDHNICYEPADAAITTVFHLDHPGESDDGFIIDADVELNAINFTFAVLDDMGKTTMALRPPTMMIVDLENTLTHELGHLIGLDHTCKDSATPANEVDETGQPPPACGSVFMLPQAEQDKITQATMYNFTEAGDIAKRDLSDDDIAGACAAYPIAQKAKHAVCKHTDLADYAQRGCALGAGARPVGWPLGALALCLLAALRRRPRR